MLRKTWPILLLVALLLSSCGAAGKSYDAGRYDADIAVQADGSLVVSETVVFRFTGGPFTYVYRDLPTGKTDGITDITATIDGRPLPEGTAPNTIEIKRGNPIHVTWHLPATSDAVHTFGLTYHALGVVRQEGDGDVLRWGALPVKHGYTIGSSRVSVTWPAAARPSGAATIIGCSKFQNRGRDLVACVNRIQRAGLQVQGGFIVGFDSDGPRIFEQQVRFIQTSGIVTAMVGLLQAPYGTRLYDRMQAEGRLVDVPSGDNVDGTTNIVPAMGIEALRDGYRWLLDQIYAPRPYYERVRTFLREYRLPTVAPRFEPQYILAFFRSVYQLGMKGIERRQYWRLLGWTLLRKPKAFPLAVTLAIYGHHFRKVVELHVQAQAQPT